MTRLFRQTCFPAFMALLAVMGIASLSGWHSATFHHDDDHAVALENIHRGAARSDVDSTVHIAAHAIGHGLAAPEHQATLTAVARTPQNWVARADWTPSGLDPSLLLKPPRI